MINVSRRRGALSFAALLTAAACVLSACGSSGGDNGTSGDGGSGNGTATKVTLLDSGTRTDFAWSEAWYDGVTQARKSLAAGASISYSDELTSASALEQAGGAALSQGSKAVIYATSEVPEALGRLAGQFPGSFACGVEVPRKQYPDGVCTIYPRLEEGAFLAGVLAAKASKTGHIGTVGAFDSPTLTAQMEGFALGARFADPDIKVDRSYTQSLTDAGKARAAAEAQYNAGADIVYAVLSQARKGVYAAAQAHHGYVVGAYFDWYPEAKDVVLTSAIYDLAGVSAKLLQLAASGKLEAKGYVFSEENASFGDVTRPVGKPGELVTDADFTEVESLRDLARSGKLHIPDATVIGHQGAAKSVDLAQLHSEAGS